MKQFIKRIVTLGLSLLLLAGLFMGCGGTKDGRIEGPGFATGEEALLAALEAVRDCDTEKLLSCYAMESFLSHYSFDNYYKYNLFAPTGGAGGYLPEGTSFTDQQNYWTRKYEICLDAAINFIIAANGGTGIDPLEDIQRMLRFVTVDKDGDGGKYSSLESYQEAIEGTKIQQILGGMQITGEVIDLTQDEHDGKKFELQSWCRRYGAEALGAYCVPVRVNGSDCFFAAQTIRYDGRWYIAYLGDSMYTNRYNGAFIFKAGDAVPVSGTDAAPAEVKKGKDPGLFRTQGPGFKTAEEAVGAYAETLRKLDLTEMAAGTMNDSIADENILLKNNHMSLNYYPVLGKTGFGEPLSRVCEANRTAQAMLVSYLKVAARIKGAEGNYQEALPGWTKLASGVDTRDSETRAALREYLSDPKIAEAFAGMEIVGMEEITDEETVKSAEHLAETYDAEAYKVWLVEARIGGETWRLWVNTVCRGGRWYHAWARVYSDDRNRTMDANYVLYS